MPNPWRIRLIRSIDSFHTLPSGIYGIDRPYGYNDRTGSVAFLPTRTRHKLRRGQENRVRPSVSNPTVVIESSLEGSNEVRTNTDGVNESIVHPMLNLGADETRI